MPISGSRKLYKIDEIQVGEAADGSGGRAIVVRMKEPIADFLSLTQLPYDDPLLEGTFGGAGSNAGYKFVKRIGGFRHGSYKIVAETQFSIGELERDADGNATAVTKTYKSISIGFPKGVSVREFMAWISGTGVASEISYIVTPRGVSHPLGPAATP